MTEASEPFVLIASQSKVLSAPKLRRNCVTHVNKFLCQYYLLYNILPTGVNEEQGFTNQITSTLILIYTFHG